MFATLAPMERQAPAASVPDDRNIHRAVQIAFGAAVTIAAVALTAVAGVTAIVAVRVLFYGLGHQHMPFFRDLFTALGL